MKRSRKKIHFMNASRSARKKAYIGIKNQLRNTSRYFDGVFYTHDVLGPHTSWADIYFLSKKHPNLFYNATIDTCAYFTKEHADNLAWSEAEKYYEEHYPQHKGCFYEHCPGFKEKAHPDLLALFEPTLYAWMDKKALDLIERGQVPAYPGAKVDKSYCFGVGLRLVVDAPSISVDSIKRAMQAFFDAGEVSYQQSTPVFISVEQASKSSSINAIETDPTVWAEPLAQELASSKEAQALEHMIPVPSEVGTGIPPRL